MADQSNSLHVLLFKDHLKSRTFKVPLGWIATLGYLVLGLIALFFMASFFALKFYKQNQKLDPTRIIDLERQVKELATANTELRTEMTGVPAESPSESLEPAPAQEVNPNLISTSSIALFEMFAPKTRVLSKDGAIPIKIDRLTAGWSKDSLQVDFNILYVAQDSGSQQGHLIVIARGPGQLYVQPDQSFNPPTEPYLLNPDRGEYFSVSRFRASQAIFRNLPQKNSIKQIQVYLFNKENQIILSDALAVSPESKIAPPPAASTRTQTPAPETPQEPSNAPGPTPPSHP